jgi:hypothetical protein
MRSLVSSGTSGHYCQRIIGLFWRQRTQSGMPGRRNAFLETYVPEFLLVAIAQFHGLTISKWHLNPLIVLCTFGTAVLIQTL